MMPETFEILANFLERYSTEAEGADFGEPSEETRFKLRQFGAGRLSRKEQDELLEVLKEHPRWIASLAQEVKALRRTEIKSAESFKWNKGNTLSRTTSPH